MPLSSIQQIENYLHQYQPLLSGNWSLLQVSDIYETLNYQFTQTQRKEFTEAARARWMGATTQFTQGLLRYMNGSISFQKDPFLPLLAPWNVLLAQLSNTSLASPVHDSLQLLLVRRKQMSQSFQGDFQTIEHLRRIIQDVGSEYPDTEIGLTGLPVLESDEMRSSQESMTYASVLSLAGVCGLFVIGFRGWRYPLLATLVLAVGIAWAFGFLTVSVGRMNILSMSFSIILIGLGVDYSIHFLSRYLQERDYGESVQQALMKTTTRVGPGLIISALTTALAFFTAAFTDFLGVAELGIIVGAGIILCLLASIVVLPALLFMTEPRYPSTTTEPPSLLLPKLLRPFHKHPTPVILTIVIIAVFFGRLALDVPYDNNLLNLQPEGLSSVEWQKRILTHSNRSAWSAVSIADNPQELVQKKEAFLKQSTIKHIDEIASMLPVNQTEKLPYLQSIHTKLKSLPSQPVSLPVSDPSELQFQLNSFKTALADSPLPESLVIRESRSNLFHSISRLTDVFRSLSPEQQQIRLRDFQQKLAGSFIRQLQALYSISLPEPITTDDFPVALKERFIGSTGKWLMHIYAKENVWEMESLGQFVHQLRSVDPRVTGSPLQTFEASRQMKDSYQKAAWYALIAITLLLLISFRSLSQVVLTLSPVGIGMLLLLGTMRLMDIPLNPANMIVLPLILGIGVDNGVHVLHDFRIQKNNYSLSAHTARAILLTSLTTMIGFGTLALSQHRGVQSLGIVLFIGVGYCLISSLAVLPAVLSTFVGKKNTTASKIEPSNQSDHVGTGDLSPEAARTHRIDTGQDPVELRHLHTGEKSQAVPPRDTVSD